MTQSVSGFGREAQDDHDTASHQFKIGRIEQIVNGEGANIVLSASEKKRCAYGCEVCGSPTTELCICGHDLVNTHDEEKFSRFLSFAMAAPIFHPHDCYDNAEFKILKEVAPRGKSSCAIAYSWALFAGSSGWPDAVKALARHVVNEDWTRFQRCCNSLPKVFRDGQYNGTFPIASYGATLKAFSKHADKHFADLYERLQNRLTVLGAFQELTAKLCDDESCKIVKVDKYFVKKILEMLYLFAHSGVFCIWHDDPSGTMIGKWMAELKERVAFCTQERAAFIQLRGQKAVDQILLVFPHLGDDDKGY